MTGMVACWGDVIGLVRGSLCVPPCSRLQLMRNDILELEL